MTHTIALVLGGATLLVLAVGRLARIQLLKGMRWPLILVALTALAHWGMEIARLDPRWQDLADVGILLGLGFLLARLLVLVVFEWLLVQRVGVVMPQLARDVVALVLYVAVAAVVLHNVLGIELTALLTTSAVLTVVIGFALQETLGTLLAGLALAWERRLEAGTWVEIDGIEGEVEELGWRSLVLRTRLDERILVPNSQVARARLRILGTGEQPVAFRVHLGVSYNVPPHAAKEVLERTARGVPWVTAQLGPEVLTTAFGESSVDYECWLWTREPRRHTDIVDAMLTRAHAALGREGMEIPFPQRTVHLAPRRPASEAAVLSREALGLCPLFAGLPDDALARLASASRWLRYAPEEDVVCEGEASRALYVVAAGEAAVVRGQEEVARVRAGDVFGEMAFLSGAPRTATVRAVAALDVVEVDSHALRALLAQHGELMEELASRMEARQQALAALDDLAAEQKGKRGLGAFLLERLQRLVSG